MHNALDIFLYLRVLHPAAKHTETGVVHNFLLVEISYYMSLVGAWALLMFFVRVDSWVLQGTTYTIRQFVQTVPRFSLLCGLAPAFPPHSPLLLHCRPRRWLWPQSTRVKSRRIRTPEQRRQQAVSAAPSITSPYPQIFIKHHICGSTCSLHLCAYQTRIPFSLRTHTPTERGNFSARMLLVFFARVQYNAPFSVFCDTF